MVVAHVVRIVNQTPRTFTVRAGDPFYSPFVDGEVVAGGELEVPPGFDGTSESLAVPWEQFTREGLVVSEGSSADAPEHILRCIVGPVDEELDSSNRDWLQYRSADWEPVAWDRWLPLGHRHLMGTVGGSVELQLTFRPLRGASLNGGRETLLTELVHFEKAVLAAPRNTVFLNVFDLLGSLSIPNSILNNTVLNTFGAFHAAVELYGEEWAFYRTPNPASGGLCRSHRPRYHPVHVYRQSINLGVTTLKDWEVHYLVRGKLSPKWLGGSYDLFHRNCIHFCDELLLGLGVKPVPSWVRGLHETGASLFRIPWPLSAMLSDDASKAQSPREDSPGEGSLSARQRWNDAIGKAPDDVTFIQPDDSGSEEATSAGAPAAEERTKSVWRRRAVQKSSSMESVEDFVAKEDAKQAEEVAFR